MRFLLCVAARWLLATALALPTAAQAGFVAFESGQVRPLALSPDGGRLFAVNTPDNQLEIFTVTAAGLTHAASVPVGLEPVAIAAHGPGEVWVVNHLSDSISIVDLTATPPRVTRTLLVGDAPRDIVFAGPGGHRAFITTAHRGQNSPIDPQFLTPSVGRADVWVFDAQRLGASLGGDPLTIVTLFGDTPRALAVSPDGATVYAAVFHSGNQTTSVDHSNVCDGAVDEPCSINGRVMPGGLPGPDTNADGVPRPKTALIVWFDEAVRAWRDVLGRDWRNAVRYALPDKDVFAIDAAATPPVETAAYAHVGTVIYNLAVNPVTGTVYASNTDANNEERFAGAGVFGGSTVRGHLHESRITVIKPTGVQPRHLNKHIDYARVPSPAGVKERSLALPTGMAVSDDGRTLYVAALGSRRIGVFDTAALEADTFVPNATDHVALSGGGPTGVVLDVARRRLYALTRFDNAVSVVDTATRRETQHLALHNPEPPAIVRGRPLLYDAAYTSSNGEAACASCHVFGDIDGLAWDLGDPDAAVMANPNPSGGDKPIVPPDFHPMKGPMTTQRLRGLAGRGPMHWRGDRTGGYDGDPMDTRAAFLQFRGAFVDLHGRADALAGPEMEALADFVLQIMPPPNPVRALDNSLTAAQQAARDLFHEGNCKECHKIEPQRGYFGSDNGMQENELSTQVVKTPHLDGVYEKVGLNVLPASYAGGDTSFAGDQVRGFGFFHDGALGSIASPGDLVLDFLLVMDSNFAPIVGQQVTLRADDDGSAAARVELLLARAAAGECEVVVKGVVAGEPRGWLRTAAGLFTADRAAESPLTDRALRALTTEAAQALTYTCVPPGTGERLGLDRDGDTLRDGDELREGSDPADPRDPCAGDCNRDRLVTIDELVRAVGVATGSSGVEMCHNADATRDGAVRIDELVRAVAAALTGC